MLIYQASIFDKGEELGDPEKDIGLFITLAAAQNVAADEIDFLDQQALVYVLELQSEEFKTVGIWWRRNGPAPAWKYRQEN